MSLQPSTTVSDWLAGTTASNKRIKRGRTKRRAEGALEAFDRRGALGTSQRRQLNKANLSKSRRTKSTPALPAGHTPLPGGMTSPFLTKAVKAPDLDFLTGGFGPVTPDKPKAPQDMSIHLELLGIGREFILNRARAAASPRPTTGPSVTQSSMLALPGAAVKAGRTFLPGAARAVGQFLTGAAVGSFFARNEDGSCPVGTHPVKQDGVRGPKGSYCVRNRRMNVGNARAARRSVRRLKGARKLLRDIEKMMPSKTSRRRGPTHATASKIIHTG